MRVRKLLPLVSILGLIAIGCSPTDSEAQPKEFVEYRVPGADFFIIQRQVRCAQRAANGDCSRQVATSEVRYLCGEQGISVLTTTGPNPQPPGLEPDPVRVRGHRGMLDFVDAGDPILVWREPSGPWVLIAAEDLALTKPQVLRLAGSLRSHGWESSELRRVDGPGEPGRDLNEDCPALFDGS